jgi:1,4-dihydroxy-2-naphthoate octaprenyltransferase
MENESANQRSLLNRILQPGLLAAALLTYLLGIGVSHYLGTNLNFVPTLLGFFLVICLIVLRNLLTLHFLHPSLPGSTLNRDDPRYEQLKSIPRQNLMLYSFIVLTAGALVTIMLIVQKKFSISEMLVTGIALLLSYFYGVPPLNIEKRGYGEITEAILIANLTPAIGFLMNSTQIHILLIMLTLPLTFLYLALKIAFSLQNYAFDRVHLNLTMAVLLDWQKAMSFHNILLLSAFLLVAVFSIFGQPWKLTWPMALPFVIGIFQIVQMQWIVGGAKPKWRLLKWTAAGTFALSAYFYALSLWIG